MFQKYRRIAAISMAAITLLGQTAYADTVVTAGDPAKSSVASQGPTETKVLNEKGYLEMNSHGGESGYVNAGPGANGQNGTGKDEAAQPGTSENPTIIDGTGSAAQNTGNTAQSGTAANNAGGQIAIDQSIAKPSIASETAIVYDATTGQTLYEKNADKAMYPASMTKLMTALLAAERLKQDDTVTFSAAATSNLESGAANVALAAGDTLSVKDTMYAMLLKSACEAANGLAEKISGSQTAFAALMNERAKQLGCTNTNFENASGLNGASHYTTARDMALITKAAVENETVRTILKTQSYQLPASKNRGALTIINGNKMINSANSQYYEGILGGKTGYTSKAGNTLATAVSKDGHELIVVVMKSSQKHYEDTKALLDYGYQVIKAAGAQSGTAQTAAGAWEQSGSNWMYKKADGSYCKNEWLDLSGKTYFFGSDSYMSTGWKQFTNGAWYYFNPQNGEMVKSMWVQQDGTSYYLQADGTMAKNTVIDNTYRVDENGRYVGKVS